MNEDAFLDALREDPADEVTWLALADWLEDDRQPDRAELLRLSRRLRRLRPERRGEVEPRVVELLRAGVPPVVVERRDSLGMRFALVPPCVFLMGSPTGEDGRDGDEVLHEVELTRPFWIGVHQVTQAQWRAVTALQPSHFSASGPGSAAVADLDTADFPVERVSWDDVKSFVALLDGRPAERAAGRTHRLPTEAEWECACRGGLGFGEPFCFAAPSRSLGRGDANFDDSFPYGTGQGGGFLERTARVGSYAPNPAGVHDMHGNLWEWCEDRYQTRFGGVSPRLDPRGPAEGETRVNRGGSWRAAASSCRAARRYGDQPGLRALNLGARLVLE